MSAGTDDSTKGRTMLHALLLELAGRAPDDVLVGARRRLAVGDETGMLRTLTFAALGQRLPLRPEEIELLGEQLALNGADPAALAEIAPAPFEEDGSFAFRMSYPMQQANAATDDGVLDPDPPDGLDEIAVHTLARESGVRGLWRTWRCPLTGSGQEPRRVFLVETDPDADCAAITGRLQDALAAVGEANPQTEVFPTDTYLPVYQRMAWAYSVLLWASTPTPDIRFARLFDEADAVSGPIYCPDHPKLLDEVERELVLGYLDACEVLLATDERMDDIVDIRRRDAVPINFRTDGLWVWNDATTYYLRQHRLEPDPGLLAHIRAAGYQPPLVDGVALHRALTAIETLPEEDPAWTYDG